VNPENKHRGELEQDFGDPNVTRGCIGKEKYPSKRHAEAAVRRMMGDGRGRYTLGAYRCRNRQCKAYHVGNNSRKVAAQAPEARTCPYCYRPMPTAKAEQRVCDACLAG